MEPLPEAEATAVLTGCDLEPIHTPGCIQPHGFLLGLDEATLRVTHASENAETLLRRPLAGILGAPVSEVLGAGMLGPLQRAASDPLFTRRPIHLERGTLGDGADFDLVAHRRGGRLLLEGERVQSPGLASQTELYAHLEPVFPRIERSEHAPDLCRLIAEEVRRLTGFDRALVYRFDEEWNGTVVAEDRNDVLPSYLDLRFPASDIPRQARELYRLNRIRLIATCDYTPSRIVTVRDPGGVPAELDLSLSTLRSVSPVHLQYMRNMGTAASMSVSIMRGDRLWGLISCHHHAPRTVPFAARSAIELLAHVFSLQLAAREQTDGFVYRMRLQSGMPDLLGRMTQHADITEGIAHHWESVVALTESTGVAVVSRGSCTLRGETPTEREVKELSEWLASRARDEQDVFCTDRLSTVFPPARNYAGVASGLLAASLSRVHTSYILWFRPEVVRTVTWGGDPRKPEGGPAQLHPRHSFAAWREVVHGRSIPWRDEAVDTAREFRGAMVSVVLKRTEELAALTEELTRSNRELAAFSYSVSHDLRAPFRHIRSYAEILKDEKQAVLDSEANELLDRILDASGYAGALVDNLLAFAQMGRTTIKHQLVWMDRLVEEVRERVMSQNPNQAVEWVQQPLPAAAADLVLLRQVWQNLLENAVKYSRKRNPARIEVGAREDDGHLIYWVQDNGAGFDMRYVDKLFGVFQRLHRSEDFEGTGIGLANVRRIVERHGGKTWAEGQPGVGATFYFSLPKHPLTSDHAQADPTG